MTPAAYLIVWFVIAPSIAKPPTLKFDLQGKLSKMIDLPKLVGVRIVTGDEQADFEVHARIEKDLNGQPAMAVWLDPTITEENRTIVSCAENPECLVPATEATAMSALFFQALDITLFVDERGLGFMTIDGCQFMENRAMLDVTSAKNIGLDHYFHYVLSNYDKTGTQIASTTQYEITLLPYGRRSAREGLFQGAGKTQDETMDYLKKHCATYRPANPKLGAKFRPLRIQLRPPELRWETQAPNVRGGN